MQLAAIKDSVSKFAEVISKTLDVDVLIVDNNLRTVSNTYRYFDKFTLIRRVSIIGQVISTGQVVAIDDKSNFNACKECPDLNECEMVGFLGVPIHYQDMVVGAIALVLPKQRVPQIFKDVRNSIEFLERMADLLSSKIQNSDDYNTLSIIKREREVLMDSIADAIVSTDDIGYITYCNKQFMKYFGLDKTCQGQMIQDVIPHKTVAEFLQKQVVIINKVFFLEFEKGSFYGFISCNNININGNRNGMLFTFKPISHINMEINGINRSNQIVTFRWAERRLFSQSVAEEAKRLAVTDRTILIQGEQGTGEDILAKSIHEFSDRNTKALIIVNCNRLYRELQEQSVFGELGKLQLAHKSSIFFQDIDRLPIYMQKRLVEFIRTGTIRQAGAHDIKIDVRMLFSTYQDLETLVHRGNFDDELYYRISKHTITIPPLREDKVLLKRLIKSDIEFYKEKHGKSNLVFAPDTLKALYNYCWPGNMQQAEDILEQIVYHCRDTVYPEHLAQFDLMEQETVQSISEIEKEKITSLLKSNRNKDDVARLLGISRATLYRKIKNYNL